MEHSVAAGLEMVEERIAAACSRSGRKREEIRLMGVTKFQPLAHIEAAWNAGLRLFGESRVQEGTEKFSRFWETHGRDKGAELHLIGSLQRNKAKAAAAFFDCIQSVDRDSLMGELGALTAGRKNPLMILLEYRTGEETKSGYSSRDDLFRAAERALSFQGLLPAGLMTMAPFTGNTAELRSAFRELREAGEQLAKRFPSGSAGCWSCLSMGMTSDFEIAVEEGSTMLRIGTAIFGERSL
jgi:pyridoxal phosphate enzyme (YggS family)